MVTAYKSPDTGNVFRLGLVRHPDTNPDRHRLRLVPPRKAPDVTKVRSLFRFLLMGKPFDQGSEGSCTANAGALVAQLCDGIMGIADNRIYSRELLYYIERELLGSLPDDSGADVVDEVDAPQKFGGFVVDAIWPYDANAAETPPAAVATATKYEPIAAYQPIAIADYLAGILTALDNNQPVAIGMNWYNGWFSDFEKLGYLTAKGMDSIAGGHALVIIGYVPPSSLFPAGAWVVQNSWGATSPAVTKLWADSRAGQVLIPTDIFAAPAVKSDAYAAVAAKAPATLSVAITGPTSLGAGDAGAFVATLTGLPVGSVVAWQWDFGDGGQAIAANASHAFAVAGTYKVTCEVSVATTGASASASMTVSVTAAPAPTPPGPGPGPVPVGVACRAPAQQISIDQTQVMLDAYAAGTLDYPEAITAYHLGLAIYNADTADLPLGDGIERTAPLRFPPAPSRKPRKGKE